MNVDAVGLIYNRDIIQGCGGVADDQIKPLGPWQQGVIELRQLVLLGILDRLLVFFSGKTRSFGENDDSLVLVIALDASFQCCLVLLPGSR